MFASLAIAAEFLVLHSRSRVARGKLDRNLPDKEGRLPSRRALDGWEAVLLGDDNDL
jgi:hypothetical protein